MIRILSFLLLVSPVSAQDSKWPPAVDVELRGPLSPVSAEGKWHTVYELHITNLERKPVTLSALEVLGHARFGEDRLRRNMYHPGTGPGRNPRSIPPGTHVILFVWLSTENHPTSLQHRIHFEDKRQVTTSPLSIPRENPIAIAPPLRGANWFAGNGPSNTSAHRRALLPSKGRLWCAQRFAVDFLQLGENGISFGGERNRNESYHAYGAELLAVAPGKVVAIKDGIIENIPGLRSRAVPITPETLAGNYIILKVAPRRFAFYAHLQPGSLRVKLGDHVKTGQILGLLGNSGNSTEPHLHFHMMNGPDPISSEGVPFTFQRYQHQGDIGDWDEAVENKGELRKKEIPLQNSILRFDLDPY